MPEDRYRALRELPFPVAAQALGIDVSKFRQRKESSEWCARQNNRNARDAFR